jgi:hypothetical protein
MATILTTVVSTVLYCILNCIVFAGRQLQYNYPDIYDHKFPESFASRAPKMADVLHKPQRHVESPPWNSEVVLNSLGGIPFHSFAKYSKFNAG